MDLKAFYRMSHLTCKPPRNHRAAVGIPPENVLVRTQNIALAG
jgi:hypothetical protein